MRAILIGLTLAVLAAAAPDWKTAVRRDHPRIFLNRDTLPAIRTRALGVEAREFTAMKDRVDALAAEWDASGTVKDRTLRLEGDRYPSRDYGTDAAEAAFVWLVTRQDGYERLARYLIGESVAFYNRCFNERRTVNWYSWSRINALAAFDWLFERYSPEERKTLGTAFLQAIKDAQPTRERRAFKWENWAGPESGYYSTPSLLWYAGLAMFGDGIDDALAERFLETGYAGHVALLEHRAKAAGRDGGASSPALNYIVADYPWADFNFFHSFRSATGREIAAEWEYPARFPEYLFWNWLPGNREFGYGDTPHVDNTLRLSHTHLAQTLHFYAKTHPREAALERWMLERTGRERRLPFPVVPFLLTEAPPFQTVSAPRGIPLARHFESMGQVFFRSGSGPDDTYGMFAGGGSLRQHKHFDSNSFVIFKKGYLALDTGTRPQPGLHLSHYYSRTAAHNAILIRMPGEQMPSYWGERAPEEEDVPPPNDGGQRLQTGSRVVAFETQPEYAYAAGDATATYHPEKCRLAMRQFVFVAPDYFVVFDRVEATHAEYLKTWLLHTTGEPEMGDAAFTAVCDGGRLFCRTLAPEGARMVKIGGPGKQFWADGRNWPLPKNYRVPETTPLLGQWHVAVSPAEPRESNVFLHLIQASDASGTPVPAALLHPNGRLGVRFRAGARTWEVTFGTSGPASGHIRAVDGGGILLDRDLAAAVIPQPK